MNAVAIQYIWQAIRESERSDDLSFIDALTRLTQARPDWLDAPSRASITATVTEPRRTYSDSLPTVTLPLLARP
jgi:hypothetical protein